MKSKTIYHLSFVAWLSLGGIILAAPVNHNGKSKNDTAKSDSPHWTLTEL